MTRKDERRRARLRALFALLAIAWAIGLALWQLALPTVVLGQAPAVEFSAERAMEDLRAIAGESRPAGSEGLAEVHGYILDEIRVLGLEPEVQATTAVESLPPKVEKVFVFEVQQES